MKEQGSYLSAAEQDRRYAGLSRILIENGCAAVVIAGPAQIGGKRYFRYFTDWNLQSFGGYLVFTPDRGAFAAFRAWSQAYWSGRIGWIERITSGRDPLGLVIDEVGSVGGDARIGIVGTNYMSDDDLSRLRGLLDERLVDITSGVEELMSVKSAEEQQLLRASGAIFDQAWGAVLGKARPGLSEWELAAVAGRELLAHGVSHSIILIGASNSESPAACVGWPRDRRLRREDVVQMSIEGPGPSGYCVEIGGTFTFGPPSADVRDQFAIQRRGMEAGVRMLAAARKSGDVAEAVDREFRDGGYRTGYPGMHGIGLGIPELPPIEMNNNRALAAGNVVAMHPNVVSGAGVGTLTSRTYVVGADHAGESVEFTH